MNLIAAGINHTVTLRKDRVVIDLESAEGKVTIEAHVEAAAQCHTEPLIIIGEGVDGVCLNCDLMPDQRHAEEGVNERLDATAPTKLILRSSQEIVVCDFELRRSSQEGLGFVLVMGKKTVLVFV